MKIIFAGTPEISMAVLQTLLSARLNVIACLTQPDRPQGRGLKLTASPVKQLALQHAIPVLQPASLKQTDIQTELRDLNPDVMIVLAYGLILPQAVLDIPKYGCINIHASLLPRWRGAAPIQHAILAGDKQTGITIMQMDAGLDTGDILTTYPCDIYANDTSAELYHRLTALASTAILDALQKLSAGKLISTPQDNALATYADKINKSDAKIDWQDNAENIDRAIRAYNPVPVAFTALNEQTIRVWRAEVAGAQLSSTMPGSIIAVEKSGILVQTGNGILRLLQLQLPGKKVLPVADLCHAHPEFKIGAQFF